MTSNAALSRLREAQFTRQRILDLLNIRGPLPRLTIGEKLGLTENQLSAAIRRMTAEGEVRIEKQRGRVGQARVILHPLATATITAEALLSSRVQRSAETTAGKFHRQPIGYVNRPDCKPVTPNPDARGSGGNWRSGFSSLARGD